MPRSAPSASGAGCPGSSRRRGTIERNFFQTTRPSSVIRRFATPDEVAVLIVFVCDVRASAIISGSLRVQEGRPAHGVRLDLPRRNHSAIL
jgi:hypothetical protein